MRDFIFCGLLVLAFLVGGITGTAVTWFQLKNDLHIGFIAGVKSGQRQEWQRLKDLAYKKGIPALKADLFLKSIPNNGTTAQ